MTYRGKDMSAYEAALLHNISGYYDGQEDDPWINLDLRYIGKEKAYRILKSGSGQDFGFDKEKWAEWIKSHPFSIKRPLQSLGDRLLASITLNMEEGTFQESSGYFSRKEAHRQLCELVGVDLGHAVKDWLLWMMKHRPDLLEDPDP